jgi:hypothetical protein
VDHSRSLAGHEAGGSGRLESTGDLLTFLGMAGNETEIVNLQVELKKSRKVNRVTISFCFSFRIDRRSAEELSELSSEI